jgi:hypothetical protein
MERNRFLEAAPGSALAPSAWSAARRTPAEAAPSIQVYTTSMPLGRYRFRPRVHLHGHPFEDLPIAAPDSVFAEFQAASETLLVADIQQYLALAFADEPLRFETRSALADGSAGQKTPSAARRALCAGRNGALPSDAPPPLACAPASHRRRHSPRPPRPLSPAWRGSPIPAAPQSACARISPAPAPASIGTESQPAGEAILGLNIQPQLAVDSPDIPKRLHRRRAASHPAVPQECHAPAVVPGALVGPDLRRQSGRGLRFRGVPSPPRGKC